MKTEFRNRAFLPVVLPVAILLLIGLLVGGFALILLYTTHEVALVLATVAAAGILLAISLAASQERLDGGRRAAVILAGATPILIGGFVAVAQPAGITDDLLNINRQPHIVLPELNVTIAAENSNQFTANEMVLPANEEVGVVFENNEAGTPHNWSLYVSDAAVESIVVGEVVTGPAVDEIIFTSPEPGEYYFQCDVHPNMNGQLVTDDGAEPTTNA
ncbi:MAG: cupredoxin domain-containing protein [Actinobacteria bacterium]|nr:cupredoxin domain-containing protein [Actinomycetota bacterium]